MPEIFWMLLLTVISLSVSVIPLVYGVTEKEALTVFRQNLSDPDNVLESWDTTLANPCSWFHIRCNQDNLVIGVDLSDSNLSGSLVPELGQLSALHSLSLDKNNIGGNIPAELGNLKKLAILHLNDNKLTGKVPSQIGKIPKLTIANFTSNNIECYDFWPTPVFYGNYGICTEK